LAAIPAGRRKRGLNVRDEFLSEEDLDLRHLSDAELAAYWDLWLRQAQATNEADANVYSHGVLLKSPPCNGPADSAPRPWS
jgi:hypothetical protein